MQMMGDGPDIRYNQDQGAASCPYLPAMGPQGAPGGGSEDECGLPLLPFVPRASPASVCPPSCVIRADVCYKLVGNRIAVIPFIATVHLCKNIIWN